MGSEMCIRDRIRTYPTDIVFCRGMLSADEPFADGEISELPNEEVKTDGLISQLYGGDCNCPTMPVW